ncbi:7-deoxyloganetin glucosyltransferase [Quercus suber]|uniref:7-deoxyloganetin glucosyltransferase n=1 Tax=Quercus suber TaxID=58331 RepID=A0AAW0L8C9_QUESU
MIDIRLRDLPSFVKTIDPNEIVFRSVIDALERAPSASEIIVHTFDELKQEVLRALSTCFLMLNSKAHNSVIYVSFGSIAVLTPSQLVKIGWGLANSEHPFLWIIRPDLVEGESTILSHRGVLTHFG